MATFVSAGRQKRAPLGQRNTQREELNNGVIEGAALSPILPAPRVTESVAPLGDYEAAVSEEVNNRNINPEQVARIRQEGLGFGEFGEDVQSVGVNEDGSLIEAPVNPQEFQTQVNRLTLPVDSSTAATDIGHMYQVPVDSKIHLAENTATRVEQLLDNTYDYTNKMLQENEPFALALGKLTSVDLEQYSHIATLTNASVLHTQASYVQGKLDVAGDDRFSLLESDEQPAVSREPKLGMSHDDYSRAAIGQLKRIFAVAGVDINALDNTDLTVMSGVMLADAIQSDQLKSTKIDSDIVYVPNGAHAGSMLGLQSDALVGNDLKQGVQDFAPRAGIATQGGKALPGLTGRKSAAAKPMPQSTTDLTKDILSNMAQTMDMNTLSIGFLQFTDVIAKLTVPFGEGSQLIYSDSPFAGIFKLDFDTADAAYKRKLYALGVDVPDLSQKSKMSRTVNKITNTRISEVYANLNKQLELVKKGKGEPNGIFYYTYGNSDINGRVYNSTHNGNYTLDKVTARQTQKAKINPYLTIKKEGWVGRNNEINIAATKLMEKEGNPHSWNKALDSMDAATEAEISFRISLVKTLLRDAKHAKKNLGNGVATPTDQANVTMAESTGLSSLRNHSNKELYASYMRINASDPHALIRHYAGQGVAISKAISGMNKSIKDLAVIEFDPNSSAQERKEQAAEAWGDISTPDSSALAEYANERGELRQQASIRLNAMKYMQAYEGGVDEKGAPFPTRFELDFEIELDATQSGPFLQALVAPSGSARDVLGALGLDVNTASGDLRDTAKELILGGDVVDKIFKSQPELQVAWQGFMNDIFAGKKSGMARELLLKQPIMQFYYGKPASMFGDISAELLGWFDEEMQLDSTLSKLPVAERVAGLQSIIRVMLENDKFDANYSAVMKGLGKWLALTDSDLVIDGPMGKINLTMESLAQSLNEDDNFEGKVTPASLRLNIVELFDTQLEEPIKFQVMDKTRTTAAPKTKSQYDPSRPVSGNNIRTVPGKKLADAIGVLLIHQLDNAVMNHTVNMVNLRRPRHNPLPAKIIYDAIIPNAAGYLRYSHTYNNESLPLAQKWDLPKAIGKLRDEAIVKFQKDIVGKETFNLSVIEGRDGHLHGVERYAVITGWLDDYFTYMPKRSEFAQGKGGDTSFNLALSAHKAGGMAVAASAGVAAGYIPPEYSDAYVDRGFIEADEVMIINAQERSNMHVSRVDMRHLIKLFQNFHTRKFKAWEATVKANKVNLKNGLAHLS